MARRSVSKNCEDVFDLGLGLDRLSLSGPKKFHKNPLQSKIVYFDVQTTGLGIQAEVIQLAARYKDRKYCDYVMPKLDIPNHVVKITGLVTDNHQMLDAYNNRSRLPAVSKEVAVKNFLKFLRSIGGNIILVAYNCLGFDALMLIGLIEEVKKLNEFPKIILGFSGVLPLLRQKWKGVYKPKNGLKLHKLAEHYIGERSMYSDSSIHVQWLEKLVNHHRINISDEELVDNYHPVKEVIDDFIDRRRKYALKKSLGVLKFVSDGDRFIGLKPYIIDRFVEHGIGLDDLSWHWECEGPEAVERMITTPRLDRFGRVNGPAITDHEGTIWWIMNNLEVFFRDTRPGRRCYSSG